MDVIGSNMVCLRSDVASMRLVVFCSEEWDAALQILTLYVFSSSQVYVRKL